MKFRTRGIWLYVDHPWKPARGFSLNEGGYGLVFTWIGGPDFEGILYFAIWLSPRFQWRWYRCPNRTAPPAWLMRIARWLVDHHEYEPVVHKDNGPWRAA